MKTLTRSELAQILENKEFSQLLGVRETTQVDFKKAPYVLTEERQKWELAKDAAALANRDGGMVVIGVECNRHANEVVEVAERLCPVRKSLIDFSQYRNLLDVWIYPRLEGIDLRWHASESRGEAGFLVIDVPPQSPKAGPFIVRQMREPGSEFPGAVGIPRRDGDRTVWDSAQDLHRLIHEQGMMSSPAKTDEIATSAASRFGEIEAYQGWETQPVYFLQAMPRKTSPTMPDFYDSVRESFRNSATLRTGSFARRFRGTAEALEGGWVSRNDQGFVWLEPNGILTQALPVSKDTVLGYFYNVERQASEPLLLHPIALVEVTYEFFRLFHSLVRPKIEGSWRYRLRCVRFRASQVVLGEQERGLWPALAARAPASSDNWDKEFDGRENLGADAFAALSLVYALFGKAPTSIPLSDGGQISEARLVALRG